jgi:hypothetical protein
MDLNLPSTKLESVTRQTMTILIYEMRMYNCGNVISNTTMEHIVSHEKTIENTT